MLRSRIPLLLFASLAFALGGCGGALSSDASSPGALEGAAVDSVAAKKTRVLQPPSKPATEVDPADPVLSPLARKGINRRIDAAIRAKDVDAALALATSAKVKRLPEEDLLSAAKRFQTLAFHRGLSLARTRTELNLILATRDLWIDERHFEMMANQTAADMMKRSVVSPLTTTERVVAKEHLRILIEAAPTASIPWEMLSKIADDDNAYAERVSLLEEAIKRNPRDPNLQRKLRRARGQLAMEAKFKGAKDRHFDVKFEGAAQERIAYTTLRLLERAYFRINQKLQHEPKTPVTVVIYTGGQYGTTTGLPDWSAGGFDGKIRVRGGDVKLKNGTLEQLLTHEYVHAALHASAGNRIPHWFHEGLAQKFAPREGSSYAQEHKFLKSAKARGLLLPLDGLDRSFASTNRARVRLAYSHALGLVEELYRLQGSQGIATLVRKVRKGKTFAAAFQSTYFKSSVAFANQWLAALK